MFSCSESQRAGVYQKQAVKLLLFPTNINLTPEFDSSVISVHITEVQSRFITVSNGNLIPQQY